jgi:hypothetical protein
MQLVSCDGCKFKEPSDLPKSKRTILPVKFDVIEDDRSSVPEGTRTYKADMCGTCRGQLLHNYFGIPAGGKLELPAFVEPTDAEREEAHT